MRTDLKRPEYTLLEVPYSHNQNPQLESVFSPYSKSTVSPDRNQSRSVAVPCGTVWISLGTALKHLQYPYVWLYPLRIKIHTLAVFPPPNVKALGIQTGRGVDLSQFHQHLFGLH